MDYARSLLSKFSPGLTIDHSAAIYEVLRWTRGPFSLRVSVRDDLGY